MNQGEKTSGCSSSPGATHFQGCACHDSAWAAKLAAAEARCATANAAADSYLTAMEREQDAKMIAEARVAELEGAMAADERRLRDAAIRVWGEHAHGCDTPDWMAEEILTLRAQLVEVSDKALAGGGK